MDFDITYIAIFAQQFGSFLIAVLALLYFNKRQKAILILGFYGLNSVLFEILNLAIDLNSNIVGNVYTLVEALILLFFFYTVFNSSRPKKFILLLSIFYCVFYFIFMIGDWQQITFSAIRMLRDLMMIGCSLLYFYFLMIDMPTITISRYPMFWIVAAFIFFFSGTFLLSLSVNYLVNVLKDDLRYLWPARNYFRFFFCLVVSYGLWLDLREVKMKQSAQH